MRALILKGLKEFRILSGISLFLQKKPVIPIDFDAGLWEREDTVVASVLLKPLREKLLNFDLNAKS
jgi:hypothetical protein